MKVSTRIFFCYLIISAACLYYPFDWILDTMRTRYLEGVEDPLVDQANTLAAAVGMEMQLGIFEPQKWYGTFENLYDRQVSARIYQLLKKQVDTRVYITDDKGIIIFDSQEPSIVGQDYSQWRDVYYTLKGEYGARTTLVSPGDENSSVLYVAAPIILDGKISGVLTVGKPTTNITWFVANAKLQVVVVAALALLVASLLSFLVSYWITRPIKRLTDYAIAIRDGNRPPFPKLDRSEIGEMGTAFENMQEALEGKNYVEQYIQNLTHEIKSPLSAIRGAAELMKEPMDDQQQTRFLGNIHNESLRIQEIIDRMLELAGLENRQRLMKRELVSVRVLIRTVIECMETVFAGKQLQVKVSIEDATVSGDSFLLHRALTNLVQNSVDFSPDGATIIVRTETDPKMVTIMVIDEGTGIADFARERIFEKFFSLQRPDTEEKSTGLGLNFVLQVALLHGGDVRLENRDGPGAKAVLTLARELSEST